MQSPSDDRLVIGEIRATPQVLAWLEEAVRQPGGILVSGLMRDSRPVSEKGIR